MTDPSDDASTSADASGNAIGNTVGNAASDALDFEAALGELEALVERMESGELTLDASLGAFERGIHLTRACQRALADAEQRVRMLLEREDGSLALTDAGNELDGD